MATNTERLKQTEAPLLLSSHSDGVVILTLNRPSARNSLSTGLMSALQAELDKIKNNNSVRVVVIEAAGEVFCAGHDLKEIRAKPGRPAYEALFRQCAALMTGIVNLPQPVIAKVHGLATAAGCHSDLSPCRSESRWGRRRRCCAPCRSLLHAGLVSLYR